MAGLRIFVYVVVLLMLTPTLISLPVALTDTSRIAFPPPGLSLRWFQAVFADGVLLGAAWRSFTLAITASVVAVAISIPCAFAIERAKGRWRTTLETFITGPRMIPQLVLAVALLVYFERLRMGETFLGLVIAHLVVSIPFAFRTVLVSVASVDRRLEWSSAILGAGPATTFRLIVLPQIKTGVIAAFIFTFILSFNNVTMALFLSGIGERTLPVEMFNRMYVGGMTPVIPAVSFLLVVVGVAVFIVLDRTIGVYKYLAGRE
ncbi:ABC transporter permease [Bosea sp. BH3]|uniref:ABC transporter permease n=1 Tax=Bosea sp. BH3 TaxID=2871701 RepID=UPI0021CB379C|nr:ABC transporter permease [Bosea sp. BH3]MCU4180403.1 ABC transporter permease [Bosea sp. BH3]